MSQIQLRTWELADLPGVQLFETRALGERVVPPHIHRQDVFTLVLSGKFELTDEISGLPIQSGEGELMVGHAGTVMSARGTGHSISMTIPGVPWFQQRRRWSERHLARDSRTNRTFARLFRALATASKVDEQREYLEQTRAWLGELGLAGPLSDAVPPTERERCLEHIRCLIDGRFEDRLVLDDLGGEVGWHPHHLQKLFQARYGLSPSRYQSQLRVEKARELLESGQRATKVALAVGYTDQSHLIRAFRRFYGLTPGTYQSRLSNTPVARESIIKSPNTMKT